MLEEYQQDFCIETKDEKGALLLLYNDDFNTFDHVIKSLVEICNHTFEQAEQCAIIVHLKGKTDIKQGSYFELLPMYEALSSRDLTVELQH